MDDVDANLLVAIQLQVGKRLACAQQRNAAARHDAFFHSGASCMQCVLDTSFLFLHLGLGRGADLNHGNTAGELSKPLLQFLAIVVRSGLLDAEAREHAGRDVVDVALLEVARRLRATVRAEDQVARIGAELFSVLAHGTGDEPDRVAARCLSVVEAPFTTDAGIVDLTAAVGLAPLCARLPSGAVSTGPSWRWWTPAPPEPVCFALIRILLHSINGAVRSSLRFHTMYLTALNNHWICSSGQKYQTTSAYLYMSCQIPFADNFGVEFRLQI